jgi:hypothetical protein
MSVTNNNEFFLSQAKKYLSYPALLFTDDGIIVSTLENNPFLSLTICEALDLTIRSLNIDKSMIIARCKTNISR